MQIADFLDIEAIVDHENEEEVDEDEDRLSKSVKSKDIVCLTTLGEFLHDEDIEESKVDWARGSSPLVDVAREASVLREVTASQTNRATPKFDAHVASVPQHMLVPLPGDPQMWAVHVKVRVKSSLFYKD